MKGMLIKQKQFEYYFFSYYVWVKTIYYENCNGKANILGHKNLLRGGVEKQRQLQEIVMLSGF